MKKAIAILILAALLSGCAQSAEPSAEVVTTTKTSLSAITMTEKEKPTESVTAAESKTTTSRRTTKQTPSVTTTTTSAHVSDETDESGNYAVNPKQAHVGATRACQGDYSDDNDNRSDN